MGRPIIMLNGKDIAKWRLTPLEGTFETLLKPPPMKKIVTNDNSSIHGTMPISTPALRRVDKQIISLLFLMRAPSLIDRQRQLDALIANLIEGEDGSGVNVLTLRNTRNAYRLIFESIDKYQNFATTGSVIISIRFIEPNPQNRSL